MSSTLARLPKLSVYIIYRKVVLDDSDSSSNSKGIVSCKSDNDDKNDDSDNTSEMNS